MKRLLIALFLIFSITTGYTQELKKPNSGGGAPTGAAGGDLTGTYPNPTLSGGTTGSGQIVKEFTPEQYGAVHDCVTDDKNAFISLATAIVAAGGGHVRFAPNACYSIYNTAPVASQTVLMDIHDTDGLTIDFNGARLVVPATSFTDVAYIIKLNNNNRNTTILSPRYQQTGVTTLSASGANFIYVVDDGYNLKIQNLRQFGGGSGLTVVRSSSAKRFQRITLDNAIFDTVYYPQSFERNGDYYTGSHVYINNAGRAYFPYNVNHHNVEMEEVYNGVLIPSILLSVFADNAETLALNTLSDITLNYKLDQGSGSPAIGPIRLLMKQFTGTTAAGVMRNIKLHLDTNISSTSGGYVVATEKQTSAGATDVTTRSYILENIEISGRVQHNSQATGLLYGFQTALGTWTGETVRNFVLRDMVSVGSSITDDILIDGTAISEFLSFENLKTDKNITLTNIAANVLRSVGVKSANITTDTLAVSGAVSTTGSPANGNLTKFSGAATITNGDLSGDCTTSGTLALICTKTNGVAFTSAATTAIGTSGAVIPLLSTANTWASGQVFVAPVLGTPASGVATNLTGVAAGLTAGSVTTNANLTGPITSVGNATSIASQTGTGTKFVMDTTPTIDSAVGKGTWTASGTWTLPAHTLGGTISGGGNQVNNVIIGTSTPLAGTFTTLIGTGGTHTGITSLGVRDTSAAFDVTLAAVSSTTLTAGRALTLDMQNVAHTLKFGATAGTITFPNTAADTVAMLAASNVFTVAQTITTNSGVDTPVAGTLFQIAAADAASAFFTFDAYGGSNSVTFRRANNTKASPTAVVAADILGSVSGRGWDTAAFSLGAIIRFNAIETWSGTARGSALSFLTIPKTTTTLAEAVRIQDSGGLSIGTTSDPGLGMLYTNAATFMIRTKTSYTNGSGASVGTLSNAPAAGNPTKWIPVDDNGTTRYIPAW